MEFKLEHLQEREHESTPALLPVSMPMLAPTPTPKPKPKPKPTVAQPDAVARTPADQTLSADDMTPRERSDFLQRELETAPSGNASLASLLPSPSSVPLTPGQVPGLPNERVLATHEWVELLEQSECLEYSSPGIDACLAHHGLMVGEQELELTGGEFLDSPPCPTLPPLSMLADGPLGMLALSDLPQRPQLPVFPGEVSRRPGLRARFPNQQWDKIPSQAQHTLNSESKTRHTGRGKRARKSARKVIGDSNKENEPPRGASRTLQFDVASQKPSKKARPDRSSWGGSDSRKEEPPHRRCSTARKSKNCMIPGCTKGARSRGLCKRHGGGKRCTEPGCTRSDQGGGFCIAHGGGKRCAIQDCKNSAQSRGLCKSHGGNLFFMESAERVCAKLVIYLLQGDSIVMARQVENDAAWTDASRAAKEEDCAAPTEASNRGRRIPQTSTLARMSTTMRSNRGGLTVAARGHQVVG